MPRYWISVRNVRNGAFGDDPEPGKSRYLRIPDDAAPVPAHAITRRVWLREVIERFPRPAPGRPRAGQVVVFVHGYNNSIADVRARHLLLEQGLGRHGFTGLVISFDWPSGTTPLGYLEDRHDAKVTAIRLVDDGIRLFVAALEEDCEISVHVVAHSMGCYVVREAMADADDTVAANKNWTTGQVAFLAGDLSSPSLAASDKRSESLYRHCYRLTNYFSGWDDVLQASEMKRVGLSPRVGRIGLPADRPPKAVDVDCTRRYEAFDSAVPAIPVLGHRAHSWYFHDDVVLRDLATTIIGAVDRHAIPGRVAVAGDRQELTGG